MNQTPTPSNNPQPLPDLNVINAGITASVRTHARKIRALTSVAFFLGFLAVAASVLIVSLYFVFYQPKQKEVLRQVTLAAEQAKKDADTTGGNAPSTPRLPFDFPQVQATMTFFHSVMITLLAGALGLLAAGTLTLLAVVVVTRRATLQQINVSLAQISTQLRQFQPGNPK